MVLSIKYIQCACYLPGPMLGASKGTELIQGPSGAYSPLLMFKLENRYTGRQRGTLPLPVSPKIHPSGKGATGLWNAFLPMRPSGGHSPTAGMREGLGGLSVLCSQALESSPYVSLREDRGLVPSKPCSHHCLPMCFNNLSVLCSSAYKDPIKF